MLSVVPLGGELPKALGTFVADGSAYTAVFRFTFDQAPELASLGAGYSVSLAGTETWLEPGEPLVPVRQSMILLPPGTQISSVAVEYLDPGVTLASGIQLTAAPAEGQMGDPADWTALVARDFPDQGPVSFSNYALAGYRLAALRVFPIQYQAESGTVRFCPDIAVTVTAAAGQQDLYAPVRNLEADRQQVAGLVENPEALEAYAAAVASASGGAAPLSNYQYVIITSSALEPSFQPLLDQKLSRGLSAALVTTEYIYANYTGTENDDNADKIRSFIRDAYLNHGTQWVLLGGDVEVVPARGVYVSTSSASETNLPTDMYYACLDGPWNYDGDSLWGEYTDGAAGGDIDLVPEVYIGRAPASNATEAANFVAKTIQYETQAHPNYSTVVLLGEKMDSYTYGSASCIDIRDTCLPADWNFVEEYDTASYTFTGATVAAALSASPHLVHHLGHASATYNARLTTSMVAGLTNTAPYFMYSQGCDSGSFDTTDLCIAEQHVVGEHGAFAVVMNAREGWYASGSGPTYSHCYAKEFFDAVFNEGILHLGEANHDSKMDNLWRVGVTGTYRWIHFETNLLGDPETSFRLTGEDPPSTPGVQISQTGGSTAVTEGGPADTYTVVLTSQPTANVTITVSPDSQVSVDPTTLVFTTANWNVPQTVTVSAEDDSLAEASHSGTITHTAASSDANYNGVSIASLTVSITDNDTAGVQISQTGGSTAATEGGPGDTYSVVLTSQPTANVTITVLPDSQVSVDPTTLVFTTANWNVPQTVTVSAVDDSLAEASHSGTITHTAASSDANYNGVSIASLTVSITDNDTAGVQISQTGGSTAVTEGGPGDTYSVVLTSQPTANVTITVLPDSQVSVDPTTLVFTTANWNVPQTVTVSAVDDSLAEGNHSGTITHTAASSDPNYNGVSIASVTVSITDNDTAGVQISQTGGSTAVTEGGPGDTYSVVLTSQPTANVTITVLPDSQVSVDPTTLVFTTANWNVPQTVTVSAVDDSLAEGNHSGTITHTAASSDPNYNGVSIASLTVSITDNDTAGVQISQTGGSTAVTEGGPADTYTVVLTSQPTANVTITVSPDSQVSVDPTTLVFTTANWNVPQTVTVSAVDDSLAEGSHSGTITHTAASSDANYNGISVPSVAVAITDSSSLTPGQPDLLPESDTGISDADNITRLDNSAGSKVLKFAVANTVPGATVALYAGGWVIGSAVASGSVTVVTTSGDFELADGVWSITARQTEPGKPESEPSAALEVTIDTTPPTVTIQQAAGQADPTRQQPVYFSAAFSEPVRGFGAADVALSGTAPGAQVASVSASGTTYTVAVSGMTWTGTIIAAVPGGAAQDAAGNLSLASTASDNLVIYEHVVRRFDFGTASSPLEAGWTRVTPTTQYTSALHYGWTAGSVTALDRASGSAMERDLVYTRDATFVVDLPSGRYQIRAFVGDRSMLRDQMQLVVEGVGSAWLTRDHTVQPPWESTMWVTGDQLTVRLRDLGGKDLYASIAGLEVVAVYTGPQLSIAGASVVEGNTGMTSLDFRVSLSQPLAEDLAVDYATADGTAEAGTDYLPVAGTLVIPAGETSAAISVPVLGDWDVESDETIYLLLTGRDAIQMAGVGIASTQATGTIQNDDAPPTLTLAIAPSTFLETAGVQSAVGTVTRNGPTDSPLIVTLASSDTTEVTVPASVTIPAGQNAATFAVAAVDDTAPDGTQRVTVTASASGFSSASAAVQVTDNEQPPFSARFDFGTSWSPVEAGYRRVTQKSVYTAASGYGWQSGSIYAVDRARGSALQRDINYTRDGIFAVKLPNGAYQVTVTIGDLVIPRDRMAVFIEGVKVAELSTNRTMLTRTYSVNVADGQLTLRLRDLGGVNRQAAIAGLKIVSATTSPNDPAVRSLSAACADEPICLLPQAASFARQPAALAQARLVDLAQLALWLPDLPQQAASPVDPGQLAARLAACLFSGTSPTSPLATSATENAKTAAAGAQTLPATSSDLALLAWLDQTAPTGR